MLRHRAHANLGLSHSPLLQASLHQDLDTVGGRRCHWLAQLVADHFVPGVELENQTD